ncbi:MAG: tetratricopeptide repeat protein [Planctomycetota bacterium]
MAKQLPADIQAILSATDAGFHATTVKLVTDYLEQNPTSQRGWIDLGRALVELCRYGEAKDAFQKAIDLETQGPADGIFGEIGHLYRAQGKFEEAIVWYQKQSNADPEDATGLIFAGNLRRLEGDHETAIELLTRATECQRGCFEEVHYSLGLALMSAGKYFDAKRQFEKAIELDPKFHAAKVALKDVKPLV